MMQPSRTFSLIGLALFFLLALALTLPSSSTAAPLQQPSSATTVPIVLRWVPHTGPRIRVPPLYAPGVRAAGATFSVNYLAAGTPDGQGATCSTWSTQAQTTFTAALNAWAALIDSSVPIRIDACWADLGATSTLGYSWSSLKGNFGAGQADTWYSSALADSLAGHDIDPSKADTHITYNTQFNWYYGTDGNPPLDKMDLMSVVMHEVGHSLNFAGSMNVDADGLGYWGYSSRVYPNIYDRFVMNGSGQSLLDTTLFPNGSYPLADQLTGNDLWFTGANATAANGGANVKIYAPFWWQPGSSYAHLDYDTFAGTANQLMVYAIDQGDAIHSPGPVGFGLLKDVGWHPPAPPPGAFNKTAPANGATGQSTSPTLSWGSSSGATSYEYCVNTSNNCNSPATWNNVGNTTSKSLSGLSANTTYYWQVRANTTSTTEANGGTWWSFTTQAVAPEAFAKTAPANGATGQPTSPTLSWGSSSGATSYEYCVNTSNNCNSPATWNNVGNTTSKSLSGLSANTTYYWQVRANTTSTTEANGGTWWSFTTQAGVQLLEETDPNIQYNGWFGVTNAGSLNGMIRVSKVRGDKVTFKFTGTSITWWHHQGSDMGKAKFTIDGRPFDRKTGVVDLCATTALQQTGPLTFSGLAAGVHTAVIQVLGTHNAACTDNYVDVDYFQVGSVITEENDRRVQYNSWTGGYNANSSGTTYRSSKTRNTYASLTFTGSSINWITAVGPNYGKALVLIGDSNGIKFRYTVNLYYKRAFWQAKVPFTDLGDGTHFIQIRVLGLKDGRSKGYGVVVDGFSGPITTGGTAAQPDLGSEEENGDSSDSVREFPFGLLEPGS